MPAPSRDRPSLQPLEPPMAPIMAAGTAVWVVAVLVLLALPGTLAAHGHQRWLWIGVAGVLIGGAGTAFMLRHDANRRPDQPGGR